MNREADHTIKGFVYQFNKTLEELLLSEEGTNIKVEGIVEDIDVILPDGIKAIQCKYHETKNKYKLSDISKPILQMLAHFANNKDKNIQYILYAHFADEKEEEKNIAKEDIKTIIDTKNIKYIASYISKIKPPTDNTILKLITKEKKNKEDLEKIKDYYTNNDVELAVNIDEFLKPNKFKFIIGKSFDNLVEEVKKIFVDKTTLSKEDIEELFYPNAIQLIAEKSIQQDETKRIIEKKGFIEKIEKTKKVAISRWTKELQSYKKLLKKRKEQLLTNLKINHRLRYFIIDINSIEDFDKQVVNFIIDYLNNYHYKVKLHSKTPVFCFQTEDYEIISEIESRLYEKDIDANTGYKGKKFYEKEFLKEPKRIINESWFEFRLRLCILSNETIKILKNNKCDDLFIIGNIQNSEIQKMLDVNIERIDISIFGELKYLLNLKRDIE